MISITELQKLTVEVANLLGWMPWVVSWRFDGEAAEILELTITVGHHCESKDFPVIALEAIKVDLAAALAAPFTLRAPHPVKTDFRPV